MAAQKIRQGNDIDIWWLLRDSEEQPYIIEGKDIRIELNVGPRKVRITEFEVSGNTVHFVYYGKEQRYLGAYILKYIENEGKPNMVTFDIKDAFTLVEHSWQAVDAGETPETIQLEFVTISSNLLERVGPAAGFGEVTAEVDDNTGTPEVDVQTSGPDTSKNIHFAFRNLKGAAGSDADVTAENIADALGYTPADANDVPTTQEKAAWDAKYNKPVTGIPATDLAEGVIPDVSNFITKSVNDLANYYLKEDTYTKAEVAALIGAIQQFHYEIATRTSDVTNPQSNVLYLIGPTGTGSDRYEEYVYADGAFTKIGDTSIDLSGYVTTQALNAALADYTTTQALSQLLSEKENIANKTTILSSASTDQQYPSAKAVYDFVAAAIGGAIDETYPQNE